MFNCNHTDGKNQIVQRIKEALATRNKSYQLDKNKEDIKKYLKMGLSLSAIAKRVEEPRSTVNDYGFGECSSFNEGRSRKLRDQTWLYRN